MISRVPSAQKFSFFLLSIILVFYVLITARLFLYPIALGVLFAYLLYPLANFLEKKRFPRILAILISIILLLMVITVTVFFVYRRLGVFVGDFPTFRIKAISRIDELEKTISSLFGITELQLTDFLRSRVSGMFEAGSDVFNRAFTATTGTLFRLGILPVFIFMFLYYRTKFAWFIMKLVPREKQLLTLNVLREVSKVASRYMGGIFTVVFVLCIINSFGLYLAGIRYAITLGVIAAIFNFIPYFGTIIGYSIPFIFALLTGDTAEPAVKVLLVFVVVQFTENNILTPNIVGNYVKINPFMIILGVIAGGMVWGLPGMFVVIPFLAVLRIISEHVPALHPYVYLLGTGGTRRHALTGENIRRFLNRLKNRKSLPPDKVS
jgi:predicted PurR-regulated permease PerM